MGEKLKNCIHIIPKPEVEILHSER